MVEKKSIEIVIPIFNEKRELTENIERLHSFLDKNFKEVKWRILIVDNASTDQSLLLAKKLTARKSNVGYLHLDDKGRGRAVKKAWMQSQADYLAYMDVDLSTDLKYFKSLI